MSFLFLWLEAPLQSWGANSKFSRRTTLSFPTKSGILGILLSAMGKSGQQKELLANFADADLQVDAFFHNKQRINTILEDFHMVGSRYNETDPWENLMIPKTTEGKKAVGGGAKLTYRYYLQDMAFGTYLEGKKDLLEEVGKCLNNPVWPIFLGRKSCVPSEIIYQGVYEKKEECIYRAKAIAFMKGRRCCFSVLQENSIDKGEVMILNDVPIQFGVRKLYKERYVTIVKNPYEQDIS